MSTPTYTVIGEQLRQLTSPEATGGRFVLFEITSREGGGTPPHTHSREDETFYILEGRYEFVVAGLPHIAEPGECLHGPRNVPHRYRCLSSTGRMLMIASPAGLEGFFKAAHESAAANGGVPNMAEFGEVVEKFGMTILS